MARSLTSGVLDELDERVKSVEVLVELEYENEIFRAWSGNYDKTFMSSIFKGVGDLGMMGDIEENTELSGATLNVGLKGASPANVALVMGQARFGRSAKSWLALMGDDGEPIDGDAGLISIYDGDMEVPVVEKGPRPGTSVITQRAVSDFAAIRRTRVRRYTDEDQKLDWPDDDGLEFITTLRDASVSFNTR